MRVGFIGLGTMGRHMATNLQKAGHDLVVHDLRPEAAQPHLAAGAVWADSPARVAEAADVIFTSLPGPPEVESVALGENGLLQAMRPGSSWFDLSTNSPALIRRLHALFAARGITMHDAPVSGGPRGAETRHMVIWVGGDEADFQRYQSVLEAMGDRPYYVGPIGAGAVVKLVHNCAGYMINTALAEVFTMGVKAGVEPYALFKAVREGAGGRNFAGLLGHFLPGNYDPPAFALALAHKDVSLATQLGRENRVPMRVANLTLEEMTEALNRGWAGRDSRVAMVLQEERTGVSVKIPEEQVRALQG